LAGLSEKQGKKKKEKTNLAAFFWPRRNPAGEEYKEGERQKKRKTRTMVAQQAGSQTSSFLFPHR